MSLLPHFPNSSNLTLKTNEVHVWLAFPTCCEEPDLIATYLSWMDEQELTRYHQFKFPQLSQNYLVAHALLRKCLSHYNSIHPADLKFIKDQYGKAETKFPEHLLPLQFSLSHTDGIVTCAVTIEKEVGIDVENAQRKVDILSIAETSFAPKEVAELQQHSGETQRHYFFQHWTLKEAYAKAIGKGLYLPFSKVAFQLRPNSQNPISFTVSLSGEEYTALHSWRFAILKPTKTHYLALAVDSPEPLTAVVIQAVPGVKNEVITPLMPLSQGIKLPPLDHFSGR